MPWFTVMMKSNGSTNEKDRLQSHPRCKHCLLDIQRTTFSNVSFRWDQVTSGLICTIPRCPSPAPTS
jgi:hypothetical protein